MAGSCLCESQTVDDTPAHEALREAIVKSAVIKFDKHVASTVTYEFYQDTYGVISEAWPTSTHPILNSK